MSRCFFIPDILEKVPQHWRRGRERPASACPQHSSKCSRLATLIAGIILKTMCVCMCPGAHCFNKVLILFSFRKENNT